jgi:hypothetical protein
MGERLELGVATGGILGLAVMAVVVVAATYIATTPVGLLIAIGIGFVLLVACIYAGCKTAVNWDAILGFLGIRPKAPS